MSIILIVRNKKIKKYKYLLSCLQILLQIFSGDEQNTELFQAFSLKKKEYITVSKLCRLVLTSFYTSKYDKENI